MLDVTLLMMLTTSKTPLRHSRHLLCRRRHSYCRSHGLLEICYRLSTLINLNRLLTGDISLWPTITVVFRAKFCWRKVLKLLDRLDRSFALRVPRACSYTLSERLVVHDDESNVGRLSRANLHNVLRPQCEVVAAKFFTQYVMQSCLRNMLADCVTNVKTEGLWLTTGWLFAKVSYIRMSSKNQRICSSKKRCTSA